MVVVVVLSPPSRSCSSVATGQSAARPRRIRRRTSSPQLAQMRAPDGPQTFSHDQTDVALQLEYGPSSADTQLHNLPRADPAAIKHESRLPSPLPLPDPTRRDDFLPSISASPPSPATQPPKRRPTASPARQVASLPDRTRRAFPHIARLQSHGNGALVELGCRRRCLAHDASGSWTAPPIAWTPVL